MPEIASKMNFADSVTVQLDNARPHVDKGNIQLLNDFSDTLMPEITIICQPPQTPKVNVNDLGFFHSLSKRCQKSECNSLEIIRNSGSFVVVPHR